MKLLPVQQFRRNEGPLEDVALPIRVSLASPGSLTNRMHVLIIKYRNNWKPTDSTDVFASLKSISKKKKEEQRETDASLQLVSISSDTESDPSNVKVVWIDQQDFH